MQCMGFPGGSVVKLHLQCRRLGFVLWVVKILWRRKWQPAPVFLSGRSNGQWSLKGYSPQGCKESGMTERLSTNTCRWTEHIQFRSASQSCLTPQPHGLQLARPPYPPPKPQFSQTLVHRVGDAIQPPHPLLSPSSAFNLSQHWRLFNESALSIRWPKFWSFSINPSNEYSGLIPFKMDWLDLQRDPLG